ncbi:hypothetical protein APY04_0804 [Hyphomicrobium sulfonivorans]|uniref:Uncharacterized protein n=1 Tax=Hyphomicrobium sulfonivorans TaxID=121290 RepID=A0A109BL28_HYPSL|nr:hypothetical protein [Hyphomicrobium sulfonivorans]KWT70743.1 hypothetical protein APY04_0804 [Hyphomicrobium sulfonivorans]
MIYGFDTEDKSTATGALLVYAVYRSRDKTRFKVSLDMWSQIQRFVKDAAKRAKSIPRFIELLSPRLCCGSVQPRWMAVGAQGEIPLTVFSNADGTFSHAIQFAPEAESREFLTRVLAEADTKLVLQRLYQETQWIVMLVRDRLERERPVESKLDIIDAEIV